MDQTHILMYEKDFAYRHLGSVWLSNSLSFLWSLKSVLYMYMILYFPWTSLLKYSRAFVLHQGSRSWDGNIITVFSKSFYWLVASWLTSGNCSCGTKDMIPHWFPITSHAKWCLLGYTQCCNINLSYFVLHFQPSIYGSVCCESAQFKSTANYQWQCM